MSGNACRERNVVGGSISFSRICREGPVRLATIATSRSLFLLIRPCLTPTRRSERRSRLFTRRPSRKMSVSLPPGQRPWTGRPLPAVSSRRKRRVQLLCEQSSHQRRRRGRKSKLPLPRPRRRHIWLQQYCVRCRNSGYICLYLNFKICCKSSEFSIRLYT